MERELEAVDILLPQENKDSIEKKSINDTIAGQGKEIDEIISRQLPFFVRWGTSVFVFLLLFILLICWFIQYPEVIPSSAKLNSLNAPKQAIARVDGRLVQIKIEEFERVKAGQILGYIESVAAPQSVEELSKKLQSLEKLIFQEKTNEIERIVANLINYNLQNDLGELQPSYQIFAQSLVAFKDYLNSGYFLRKKSFLKKDLHNLQKIHKILTSQKALLEKGVSLSLENFEANETLAKKEVISQIEYREKKIDLISRQLSLPKIYESIISNESMQNEKRKEIDEFKNTAISNRQVFLQALRTMKSEIQMWEHKHLLKAPVSGVASFSGFLQESQEVKTGQALFTVQPYNTSYFVEVMIPQYNLGKVEPGQQVLLKFQAYPHKKYGSVVGEIEYIDNFPTDNGYLAKVSLPNGLITNQNKPLRFKYGLTAKAEIITSKMRLLERFLFDLLKE